jgi:alpha-tubulin suppressor-like RCC1 family protein
MFRALRQVKIVGSAVALLGLLAALALWQISPPPLRAAEPALLGIAQSLPQEPVPLDGIIQVAAGDSHTCALTSSGGVKCWGYNSSGQLGDGTTERRTTPVDVVGLDSGVQAIAAGFSHTCALTSSGGVKCWGHNDDGQLGDGTTVDKNTPVDVVGLGSGVQAIAAGGSHTCALTSGGGVTCWGYNYHGQLGDGTRANKTTPVDVTGLGSGAQAIALGGGHTCALTSGGGVKCWGYNYHGQTTPVDVVGLGSGVQAIALGDNHTCALTSGGGVKCWGQNWNGELGDGTTGGDRFPPVDVVGLGSGVQAIAAGLGNTTNHHTCALTSGGGVKCWGDNRYGQLGDGTTGGNRNTPVDVAGLGSGVQAIAPGGAHTCALTTGGGVKCWGSNAYGQLGDGTSGFGTDKTTPVDVAGLDSGMQAIAADEWYTCALTSGGGVKCWGRNFAGQLGDGTTGNKSTPVDVVGLGSGVQAIALGSLHTCALTSGGGVKCWGDNITGQLGDGTRANKTTPVDVTGLGSGAQAIAAGFRHTCALTSGGGVKCWGGNNYGQLGDGTTASKTTPVDVVGLGSGVQAIAAGSSHTCALTSGGGVKCWGRNFTGALGNGTTGGHRSTPVNVVGLGSGVQAIAAGGSGSSGHTCALTGGGVKCWGHNDDGQLGDGTTAHKSTPVDVAGLGSGVQAIAPGGDHTCALTSGGGVKCWGWNQYGQVGDGTAWRTAPVDVLAPLLNQPTATPTPMASATSTPPAATATPTSQPAATSTTSTPTATPTSQPAATTTPTATSTPTPVTAVIAPNQDGSISGQVGDLAITAQFPAGAHTESFTVSLQPVADPPTHGDRRLLGQVFSLTAKDGNGQPVTKFGRTFTITINYSGNDWADLADLSWSLFYWNDTELRWIEVPTQQISPGIFAATLDHLTNFALLEAPPRRIYLPAIQR